MYLSFKRRAGGSEDPGIWEQAGAPAKPYLWALSPGERRSTGTGSPAAARPLLAAPAGTGGRSRARARRQGRRFSGPCHSGPPGPWFSRLKPLPHLPNLPPLRCLPARAVPRVDGWACGLSLWDARAWVSRRRSSTGENWRERDRGRGPRWERRRGGARLAKQEMRARRRRLHGQRVK